MPSSPQKRGDENLGSVSQALEHCGGIACTGLPDCTAVTPVCANPTTIACPTVVPPTPRECVYSLKISASCPCLEHDVRLCTISGSPGVQICNKVTSTTTAWGSCQTTPACTPWRAATNCLDAFRKHRSPKNAESFTLGPLLNATALPSARHASNDSKGISALTSARARR